jgi:hypothetical protein
MDGWEVNQQQLGCETIKHEGLPKFQDINN